MNVTLIDTHCHLDLEPLRSGLPHIVDEAVSAGVQRFVVPGVHPDNWPEISAVAAENRRIMPAYGIHPLHAGSASDPVLERLLAFSTHGVAIGEIGLDPACPVAMALQESTFRAQLRIAVACGVPVLIHCRRAFQKVLTILREEQAYNVGGIMHSFSGSVEMAREFIRLGFAISIAGAVTWNKAVKPLHVAKEIPLEHLVLESDAPDMAPERYRGACNRPAWIIETALRVAELRDIALEEVARTTTANALRILRPENCPA